MHQSGHISKLMRQFLSLYLSLFTNNRTGKIINPSSINLIIL
nr:hypothetical protein [Crocosphaera watsonii]